MSQDYSIHPEVLEVLRDMARDPAARLLLCNPAHG
jgi:hypothetical protein